MLTDRELLEFAAKAAGKVPASDGIIYAGFGSREWNPRDDNYDSFGLMVKCSIDVEREGETVVAWYSCPYPGWDNGQVGSWIEPLGDNPEAATRLAILMAAAEIGKWTP